MAKDYRYCSGILPFTYFNQSVYFLLGKSKRNNRLTTFSGKNDDLETEPSETAAREGYEETLGCLMDKMDLLDRISKCKEDKIIHSFTPRGMPCFTFLVEVPFRKHYILTFHRTKDFITTMGIRSYQLQEMSDIKWVCAKTMFTKIRKVWERNSILSCDSEWKKMHNLVKTENTSPIDSWRRDDTRGALDSYPTDDDEDVGYEDVHPSSSSSVC